MTQRNDRKRGLDLGFLEGLIGFRLRLAQIALFEDFERALRPFDITPTRFGALALIDANPGLSQMQLAKAIRLDRSTLVALLDHLEGRGLVLRRPSATDKRTNELSLTGEGRKLLGQLKRRVLDHEKRTFGKLSADERAQLARLLEAVSAMKTKQVIEI
ncbi:Transcriptional regulator, MarR family [Rhodospirillaceae bacterium LM-1]|nr:Transcriptional regulator, MarR family [Rhodospirillaceae bacterium LM-1]